MAAPTSPYTTAEAVSYLLINLFKGGVPGPSTTPDATKTAQAISWAAGWLEMSFADVGYIIPFQDLTGETWPDHQTTYLSMINAMSLDEFSSKNCDDRKASKISRLPCGNLL